METRYYYYISKSVTKWSDEEGEIGKPTDYGVFDKGYFKTVTELNEFIQTHYSGGEFLNKSEYTESELLTLPYYWLDRIVDDEGYPKDNGNWNAHYQISVEIAHVNKFHQ